MFKYKFLAFLQHFHNIQYAREVQMFFPEMTTITVPFDICPITWMTGQRVAKMLTCQAHIGCHTPAGAWLWEIQNLKCDLPQLSIL